MKPSKGDGTVVATLADGSFLAEPLFVVDFGDAKAGICKVFGGIKFGTFAGSVGGGGGGDGVVSKVGSSYCYDEKYRTYFAINKSVRLKTEKFFR